MRFSVLRTDCQGISERTGIKDAGYGGGCTGRRPFHIDPADFSVRQIMVMRNTAQAVRETAVLNGEWTGGACCEKK